MGRRRYDDGSGTDLQATYVGGTTGRHFPDAAPYVAKPSRSARHACSTCKWRNIPCDRCMYELAAMNGSPNRGHQIRYRTKRVAPYKLTLTEYEQMILDQDGRCAICDYQPPLPEDLDIDHNHTTKEVRGLLCEQCNRALGAFADSPFRVDRALTYLKERGHYGEGID